jgi:tyrosine-protein phosphatase SIW14
MIKLIAIWLFSSLILILFGCAGPKIVAEERPTGWSQKVELQGLSNIYKIDEHVYRSEQPDADEMIKLNAYGIKSVLNLRRVRNDHGEAKGTDLTLHHVPINTWRMSYEDLVKSMAILQSSKKPVLVHCIHGSDRTGCVIAAYRIIQYGWTKEEAIKELVEGGYGYHAKWFPNILELINSLDVEKLEHDVQIASGI